jgi:hypothetical protein
MRIEYRLNSCSHRLYHVPQITDGKVEHYADSYDECLDLAKNNATFATLNTHSLQYFANHVYAYVLPTCNPLLTFLPCSVEVAQGGDGCIGRSGVASAPATPASATSSAALACRKSPEALASQFADTARTDTHADGALHCE